MRVLFLLMLTTLLLQIKTGESLILDNNQFLIYNKVYPQSRLTLVTKWGRKDVRTFDDALYPDQLWTLEPHPSREGCYYIVNEVHSQYRIANSKHKFVAYSGPHYNDQLFKFVPSGNDDGFYYIYSCHYTNDRIAKYGVKKHQLSMDDGPLGPKQLWKLVPRFTARFFTETIFQAYNRPENEPITKVVPVTTGLIKSTATTILNTDTFKQSIEVSFNDATQMLDFGETLTTELSSKLKKSLKEANEDQESWYTTENMTLTIPPGKNVRVMQHVVFFEGSLPSDSCSLQTSIKVFESDTAIFDDPDGFIIAAQE